MPQNSINIRLRFISDNKVIYGQGISKLLQIIDKLGSIKAASDEMGMTYKKALDIIKNAELGFGQKILTKQIGGKSGGGSQLTEFGKELVYKFKFLEDDILNYAYEKSNLYFENFINNKSDKNNNL